MKLNIFPSDSVLIGDEIFIKIKDVKNATIHVRRKYFDGDVDYSYAEFEGDADTCKDAPLAGSYSGVDASGLFWSLKSTEFNDVLPEHLYEIDEKYCGHFIIDLEVDKIIIESKYLLIKDIADDVISVDINEGSVRGKLFYKESNLPQGIVIHVAGEDGIAGTEANAKLLASKGIATLALPHYKYLDLPKDDNETPLEYFSEAIEIVKKYDFIDSSKIGMLGYTRGAELALLLASRHNEIKFVIASNPSCVLNQSIDSQYKKPKSSWSINSIALPFLKIKKSELIKLYLNKSFKNKKGLVLSHIYDIPKECKIDVENVKGDILLLAGEEDCRWHSLLMSNLIKKRLNENSFSHQIELLQFKNAGQVIGGPGFLPTTSYDDLTLSLGGTSDGNGKAQYESWYKIIAFIKSRI